MSDSDVLIIAVGFHRERVRSGQLRPAISKFAKTCVCHWHAALARGPAGTSSGLPRLLWLKKADVTTYPGTADVRAHCW